MPQKKKIRYPDPATLPDPQPNKLGSHKVERRSLAHPECVVSEVKLPTAEGMATDGMSIPPADAIPNGSALSPYTVNRVKTLLGAWASRKREALKLFEPLPVQQRVFESKARELLIRGSNQAGKTLTAYINLAMILMGIHPLSGKKGGYPKCDGRMGLVGFDLGHVGRVLYTKLFKPGAFKIIRDLDTGEFRAYRPWTDSERSHEAKPAPPLVPGRMIKGKVSWYKKGLQQPQRIVLKNGWEIYFFSSEAEPPQGDAWDVIAINEEVQSHKWYVEAGSRLLARKGRFIWDATPHVGGDSLLDLHDRALSEAAKPNPAVEEFLLTLADNPHIDQEEKDLLAQKHKYNPEHYRVRVLGEYAAHGATVYPEYTLARHGYEQSLLPELRVPQEWSRWAIIDPSRQLLAVLFAAIPPEEDFVLFYDELAIEKADARKFGEQMEVKTRGQFFEGFAIDRHGSNVHESGSGLHREALYVKALKVNKVWERVRRKAFIGVDDDRVAGIETFRDWLNPLKGDKPRARFLTQDGHPKLPVCDRQMTRWHYVKKKGEIGEKPDERGRDFPDCGRYIAMLNPKYRKPPPKPKAKNMAQRRLEEKREQNQGKRSFINLGPTALAASA